MDLPPEDSRAIFRRGLPGPSPGRVDDGRPRPHISPIGARTYRLRSIVKGRCHSFRQLPGYRLTPSLDGHARTGSPSSRRALSCCSREPRSHLSNGRSRDPDAPAARSSRPVVPSGRPLPDTPATVPGKRRHGAHGTAVVRCAARKCLVDSDRLTARNNGGVQWLQKAQQAFLTAQSSLMP